MGHFYQITRAFLVALLVVNSQSKILPVPINDNVDSLCAAALCEVGTICRVVQGCAGPACSPQAACVSCVPSGVDEVCNRNRYLYAVLVGSSSSQNDLEERKCDPTQLNGEPNCPEGSVCVADGNGRGSCCFGKPDPAPEVGTDVSNNDPVCDPCGGCRKGYVCRTKDVVCISPPCSPVHECVLIEKPGYCPFWPLYVPLDCPYIEKDQCEFDGDCPDDLKCCSDQCGTRVCFRPYFK